MKFSFTRTEINLIIIFFLLNKYVTRFLSKKLINYNDTIRDLKKKKKKFDLKIIKAERAPIKETNSVLENNF